MRDRARAVVIGGGVGGCSILYWLASARLGRRRPRRAGRADEAARRSIPPASSDSSGLALAHEDDDELGRSLSLPRGRGRAGDGLEGGRLPAPYVVAGAHGGDRARPAGRRRSGCPSSSSRPRRRAGTSPDDDGRRPGRRLPADGRLRRPEPAHARARGGRPPPRRRGEHGHPRDGDAPRAGPCARRRDGPRRRSRPRSS